MWNETRKTNQGGKMSIINCDKCDKVVDIDYEDVFDIEDYKMICIFCEEGEEK